MVWDALRRRTRKGNWGAKVLAILLAVLMVTSVVVGVLSYIF